MGLLDDRVAVVTGAGRGIGRAIAETFVREGARVVINDLEAEPAAEALAACEAIRAGAAVTSVGSVTDPAYTDALMKQAVDAFGQLDILINNAGVSRDRMGHKMSDAVQFDRLLDIVVPSQFQCLHSGLDGPVTGQDDDFKLRSMFFDRP